MSRKDPWLVWRGSRFQISDLRWLWPSSMESLFFYGFLLIWLGIGYGVYRLFSAFA